MPDFYGMHEFFEDRYKILDEVAESIRTLGHYAPATLKDYLELTKLTEKSREGNDSKRFIKELLADHEAIIIRLLEKIDVIASDGNDFGTCDFMTWLMETHEEMAWMLRSRLSW